MDRQFGMHPKENADYKSIKESDLAKEARHILKDEKIEVSYKVNKEVLTQQMRRVAVFSWKYQKAFVYITNNINITAVEIAVIYANRWQIETFFKKLKHPA